MAATVDPSALYDFGPIESGESFAFLSVDLQNQSLVDIHALAAYVHLTRINLSHNRVTDLTPLSGMRSLTHLDASHNELDSLLAFTPPVALQHVDFSHNRVTSMPDLSTHKYLRRLVLDHNCIQVICGLHALQFLTVLSLRDNQITTISGLDGLNLDELHLSGNPIASVSGLAQLPRLRVLSLDRTDIRSVEALTANERLAELDVRQTRVTPEALGALSSLRLLASVRLRDEAIDGPADPPMGRGSYREAVLAGLQQLSVLDGVTVTAEEKVDALIHHGLLADLEIRYDDGTTASTTPDEATSV